MSLTPERYFERLTQISVKKRQLLDDILQVSRSQAEAISKEDTDKLGQILNEKQTLISEIDKLDEEFNVYFHRLKQQLGVKTLDEVKNLGIQGAKELQETVSGIMSVIKELNELDKQNNSKAQAFLDGLAKEIRKVNEGKKVNSAYNPGPVQGPSYFFDKKN